MHAIQCCVPDATLLPAGIERLRLADPGRVRGRGAGDPARARAVARRRHLRLRPRRLRPGRRRWSSSGAACACRRCASWTAPARGFPALLGPYLERQRRAERSAAACARAVRPHDEPPTARSPGADRPRWRSAGLSAGPPRSVTVRTAMPRGRTAVQVTASHGAGVTFAVAGERRGRLRRRAGRRRGPMRSGPACSARTASRWPGCSQPSAARTCPSRRPGSGAPSSALRKTGHATVTSSLDAPGPSRAGGWCCAAAAPASRPSRPALHGVTEPVVFTMLAEGGEAECRSTTSTGKWSVSRRPTWSATSTT